MEEQDKKQFLNYCRQRVYPRQALLFEYFLDKLFLAEANMVCPPLCLPQTTAFTLFLYAGCCERGVKKGVLAYFPCWHLDIKTDLYEYARFVPADNLVNCPLPEFVRTAEGICRRMYSFNEMELRAIRLNFGLSADWIPNSDELRALAFAEDEIAAMKTGLDKAADMLRRRTAKWP